MESAGSPSFGWFPDGSESPGLPVNSLSQDDVDRELQKGVGSQFDPSLAAVFFTVLPDIYRVLEENPDQPRKPDASGSAALLCHEAVMPVSPSPEEAGASR
jgi:hypothetical protein